MQAAKAEESIRIIYMAKNLTPKCKQCRRIGEKLFLKGERCSTPKCALVRRNYPPGMHGPKGSKSKQTDYGHQLKEKQKAKKEYNLLEKQFKLIYKKSKKMPGDSGENILQLLEMRLDNIVYRLGFAASRVLARQIVSHGHILVNNNKVNIPSFNCQAGDEIKIKENSKKLKIFSSLKDKLKKWEVPGWINFDSENLIGKIINAPKAAEISTRINPHVIIEFYSR